MRKATQRDLFATHAILLLLTHTCIALVVNVQECQASRSRWHVTFHICTFFWNAWRTLSTATILFDYHTFFKTTCKRGLQTLSHMHAPYPSCRWWTPLCLQPPYSPQTTHRRASPAFRLPVSVYWVKNPCTYTKRALYIRKAALYSTNWALHCIENALCP